MDLFRKSKKITFSEKDVTIYEISAESYLKLLRGEVKDDFSLLKNNISLSEEELKNLNPRAFEVLMREFLELNKELFETSGSEKVDEKK